jgi:hypothetical protein
VVIAPALDNKTYSRWSRAQEMIELGERAAEALLPLLRAKVGQAAPAVPAEPQYDIQSA